MEKRKIPLIAFVVAATLSLAVRAEAMADGLLPIWFAYPPKITSVSANIADPLGTKLRVSATFEAQTQYSFASCKSDPSNCPTNEWLLLPDQNTPNPPDIKKAWVYYFTNGNPDGHQAANKKVEMIYNVIKDHWEADIPIDPSLAIGDTIQYYLVVVDSQGNVTSEEPDPKSRPCPTNTSWVQDNATPKVTGTSGGGSCDYANSYRRCVVPVGGHPSGCNENYTLSSPANDTCGEPYGGFGDQTIVSGQDNVDLIGFSAGADDDFFCLNIGLGGPQPVSNDRGPIEVYIALLINPDLPDATPDLYMQNAYAITFSPDAAGVDPTLFKVLWDGECATRPGQSDILGCRLIAALSGNPDFEFSFDDTLKMKVKRSGVGTPLAKPFNLIGDTSKMVYIILATAEVDPSATNTFWFVNKTQSLGLVARRHEYVINSAPASASVFIISAPDGALRQTNTTLPMVDCEAGKCFASTTLNGVTLRVYDMKGPGDTDDRLLPGKSHIPVVNGGFSARLNPADVALIDGKKKVKLVLEVPLDIAQANHFPCDTQKTDPGKCFVTIMKNIEVKDSGGNYPITDLPNLPGASGGGKEVGNIYCDTLAGAADGVDPVDMQDFSRLKIHFGTAKTLCTCPTNCASGQGGGKCYTPFADINGDGAINMVDYAILKTFFKKTVNPAPRVMPKDAEGNDLCTTE